jgi:hypothetical protein
MIININGNPNAGRDMNITEGNVVKDNLINIYKNYLPLSTDSPKSDVGKVIGDIKYRINESDIDPKRKTDLNTHLDGAIESLKDENIDKKSIAENIKKTNEILKEAKVTGETLKDVVSLIENVVKWLGPYAKLIGLI